MKVVLFCGGEGTRIRDASPNIPKPLLNVAGLPIIFRLMAQYAASGHIDFVLCAGYKKELFDEFKQSIVSQLESNNWDVAAKDIYGAPSPKTWNINVVDTGECCIGERLWKVQKLVSEETEFLVNYSDAVALIDVNLSVDVRRQYNAICSIAAVKPSQYYHWLDLKDDDFNNNGCSIVMDIIDSAQLNRRINGGFMCMTPEIFNFMQCGEELVIEPFKRLIKEGQLVSYDPQSYWRSIDTYKDLILAENELKNFNLQWLS